MRAPFVVIAALGALALAGSAQAASWKVAMGEQTRPPAGTPKMTTLNAFFPSRLVIDAGDSVTFSSAAPHTATYLGGGKPPALLLPDPSKAVYEGIDDAAGQPFAFDGLPKFIYNPVAFAPIGGKVIQPGTPVSTGFLASRGPKAPPATATYSFPKAGAFQILCNLHPGMKMTVLVKSAASPVPLTPAQVSAKELTDQAAAWSKAKALTAGPTAKDTVYAGVGGSPTILSFFPQVLNVKAGTTVTFVNKSPTEVHNMAFGPPKYLAAFTQQTDLLPQGPKAKNQVTPVFLYGSEGKGPSTLDRTNHGNGFLATQLISGSKAIPLPRSTKVTFSKPGTYKYICILHGPDMSGTVVVTP